MLIFLKAKANAKAKEYEKFKGKGKENYSRKGIKNTQVVWFFSSLFWNMYKEKHGGNVIF